ncbi:MULTISPECIES: hypothetical protein [unclassified Agreia]|uniref:hypothetical protein n=1 Tax=unclassified Agreia TaxID=2641148 RepID=UPI0006F7597C|nr:MULTISPECIES: hypothetical protein [Microbacteriaceae]KQM58106.1 hypothetical protein ASE64_11150 [Agreia sp. Leaf210]KQR22370.1 hypothetical protein ASF79_08990 [Agreia sp. Leaf335]PPF65556.1 hypothetical protein C5E11_01320 [Clavibacter michiganensis]
MIDDAYPVPFAIERRTAPHAVVLTNRSSERLTALSFSLLGTGALRTSAPLILDPGRQVRLVVTGEELPRRGIVVVRWFRPDGTEYLWRITF